MQPVASHSPRNPRISLPVPEHRNHRRRGSGQNRAGRLSANALDLARRSRARHGPFSDGKALARHRQQRNVIELEGDDVYSSIANTASEQVTSLVAGPGGKVFVATANPGKIFTLGPGSEPNGSFESDAFDAKIFSRWGRLTWWGDNGATQGKVEFYVRSGNTSTPEDNWSPWAGPYKNAAGEAVTCPLRAVRAVESRLPRYATRDCAQHFLGQPRLSAEKRRARGGRRRYRRAGRASRRISHAAGRCGQRHARPAEISALPRSESAPCKCRAPIIPVLCQRMSPLRRDSRRRATKACYGAPTTITTTISSSRSIFAANRKRNGAC